MNLALIQSMCKVKKVYTTPKHHTLVWYEDGGQLICESDFVDEGENLMWSCDNEEQFQAYCEEICSME